MSPSPNFGAGLAEHLLATIEANLHGAGHALDTELKPRVALAAQEAAAIVEAKMLGLDTAEREEVLQARVKALETTGALIATRAMRQAMQQVVHQTLLAVLKVLL
jgi:hypothetical protein